MIIYTVEQAKRVKERYYQHYRRTGQWDVTIDTETESLPQFLAWDKKKKNALIKARAQINIWSICYRGEAYSFPTNIFSNQFPTFLQWMEVFASMFYDKRIVKVFHNANYDQDVLYFNAKELIPKILRPYWCTMIGAWKADAEAKASLKERAPTLQRYLNKTKTINFADLGDLAPYAEQDVIATDELYQLQVYGKVVRPETITYITGRPVQNQMPDLEFTSQTETMSAFDRIWLRYFEFPIVSTALRMQRRGFPYDIIGHEKMYLEAQKEIDAAEKDIYAQVGYEFNIGSGAQLGKALIDYGFELPLTKTGKPCTNFAALNELILKNPKDELVKAIQKYKQFTKLLDYTGETLSYPDNGLLYYVGADGCIHASIGTTNAVTGRSSCCVTGDTLVKIVGGHMPILDVISLHESNKEVTADTFEGPKRVSHVFRNGPQQVYEVYTETGKKVRATREHRFLTPSGWKQLKDLKEGDLIAELVSDDS